MELRLNQLISLLSEGKVDKNEVTAIDGSDGVFTLTTQFLNDFPQLEYYDGNLTLSTGGDLILLRRLKWQHLSLDLADTPFEVEALLLALEHKPKTTLILGSMHVTYQPPRVTVYNFDPHYRPLLLQLLTPKVHTLVAPLTSSFAAALPPWIQEVETVTEYWQFKPSHPLTVRSTLLPPQPQLDANIIGLNVPLPFSMVPEILNLNPQLRYLGLEARHLTPDCLAGRRLDGVWIWAANLEEKEYASSLIRQLQIPILLL